MQRYQILKLSAAIGQTIFIFQKNTTTGFYDPVTNGHAGELPTRKSIMDFIGLDNVKIISVLRTRDNVTFETSNTISVNGSTAIIKKIIFKEGVVQFGYGPDINNLRYVIMEGAILYTAPDRNEPQPRTVSNQNGTHGTPTGNIADLETEIVSRFDRENRSRIRLSQTKKRRLESLHEFLIEFFSNWNQADGSPAKNTVFVDGSGIHTANNKRRSLGDIYMICKYYYPSMTLTQLLRELYIELPRHFAASTQGFRTSICSQINKRVWYYDSDALNDILNSTSRDEYGKIVSWYTENIRQ